MDKHYILTEENLDNMVDDIISLCNEKKIRVITLSGDLGAGKTTLTKCIGKQLGVDEHITSPTYTLSNEYTTSDKNIKKIMHIDAYRLSNPKIDDIGINYELFNTTTLIIIEWPEHIANLLSQIKQDILTISIKDTDEETKRQYSLSIN